LNLDNASVSSVAGAAALLDRLDGAISVIGGARADLGALQNRFQSRIRSLSQGQEQLSGARSRIRDTDFAAETAEFTRNQIMQQASLAILSQANRLPELILRLIG